MGISERYLARTESQHVLPLNYVQKANLVVRILMKSEGTKIKRK